MPLESRRSTSLSATSTSSLVLRRTVQFTDTTTTRLFWGQDRMHMLEAELISIKLSKPVQKIRQLERLHPRCLRTGKEARIRVLTFWFDFSSPWSYLGW